MTELEMMELIGNVKDGYIAQAQTHRKQRPAVQPKRRSPWKLILIAATMVFLLTGCAAVIYMSLERQTLHQEVSSFDVGYAPKTFTVISLQGLEGSPQFQAAQEWMEFHRNYDPDSKIIQSVPEEEMDQGEEYYSYSCYTPEMARKIDEICEKYDLQKQGMPQYGQSWENICQVLQIEHAIDESTDLGFRWNNGYMYRTGTFMMEGDVLFASEERVGFQLSCVSKKDFDTVFLNIGDPEQYEQWTATMADGGEALLALSPEKALILADREDKFVSLNFMLYDRKITREELEEVAALLDFSFRMHSLSDEGWNYLENNKIEYKAPTIGTLENSSYTDRVQNLLDSYPNAKNWGYALMDLDGDDSLDLVIGKDGLVLDVYTTDGENTYESPVHFRGFRLRENAFGNPLDYFSLLPSYGYVCEDNKLLYVYHVDDGTNVYKIAGVVDGKVEWIDMLIEDPAQNTYFRSPVERGNSKRDPITKEQLDEVLDACVPIEIEMKPLTEWKTQDQEEKEEPFNSLEDYEAMFRKPSYAAFLEGYKDQKMYQNSEYILRDVTGDGKEELIMQKDSMMRSQNDDGAERNDPCKITLVLTMGEDGLTRKLLHEDAVLYEGDVFGGSIDWDGNTDNYWHRVYFRLRNDGRHETVETIRYFSETKTWQRTNVPGASTEEDWELDITEEQAMAYVGAYKRADMNWKPITEFPMN